MFFGSLKMRHWRQGLIQVRLLGWPGGCWRRSLESPNSEAEIRTTAGKQQSRSLQHSPALSHIGVLNVWIPLKKFKIAEIMQLFVRLDYQIESSAIIDCFEYHRHHRHNCVDLITPDCQWHRRLCFPSEKTLIPTDTSRLKPSSSTQRRTSNQSTHRFALGKSDFRIIKPIAFYPSAIKRIQICAAVAAAAQHDNWQIPFWEIK